MEQTLASFTNSFDVDDREPLLTFPVVYFGTLGLTGFSVVFWLKSFFLLTVQSIVNLIAALVIHQTVLKHRGSTQSFIFGYGIICPALLYVPFVVIRFLQLNNVALILCVAGSSPALLFFRCIEAMHSTLPPYAEQGLGNFLLYYSTSLQFEFDPKTGNPMRLTRGELLGKVSDFAVLFVQTTVLYSILLPADYSFFPTKAIETPVDLVYHVANNFVMAFMTGSCLEAGVSGLGVLTSLCCGLRVMTFNESPLTQSSSPSDFWGKRWDKLIGSALRRGVFRPLRNAGYSHLFAALATFILSGLLHEYMLIIMATRGGVPNNPSKEPYVPAHGAQLTFFAWNGILLLGEFVLRDSSIIRWCRSNLPKPVRTTIVLLMVLPVSHLFTNEYIRSCFYSDIAMGFPRFIKLS